MSAKSDAKREDRKRGGFTSRCKKNGPATADDNISLSCLSCVVRSPERRIRILLSSVPSPRVALHVICIETSRRREAVGSDQRPIEERCGCCGRNCVRGAQRGAAGRGSRRKSSASGGIRRKTEGGVWPTLLLSYRSVLGYRLFAAKRNPYVIKTESVKCDIETIKLINNISCVCDKHDM